ncbi:MAG TPA: hypothetical protein VLM36_00355 [Sphingomicrobium sp.]|nr:hypothetical protein [Sphingomicrobium sp.]
MKKLALLLLAVGTPASADVVSASANGFEVRETVPLVVPPDVAFKAFGQLPSWWDPEHTYSGQSSNLRLELVPGGCFCERIPKSGGGVEHMRVAFVDPGKRLVMTGALGPLLYEATTGVMDIEVKTIAGGSQLTLDYKVAGFANGGAEKLAGAVDGVLGEQMKRFRTYATSRPRS